MINRLFITAFLVCLLPAATAFGQELRKEKLKGTSASNAGANYAVFYSYGMPESAVWPLGMKLSRDGATIRHTHTKGNGENIPVNDRVPFRFIIAPNELSDGSGKLYWAEAMSFHAGTGGDNNNLDPDGNFTSGYSGGCKNYSTTEFPSGWRLPTQREMMLIWLFRSGINTIYGNALLGSEEGYWTATENTNNQAWYLFFSETQPELTATRKTTAYRFRCVRDY